jgi:CRISPR-associated protein Csb1
MQITAERLLAACADTSEDGGVRIWAALEPLGGAGTPVKPAVYAGGKYQIDKRWWGSGDQRKVVSAVVIDNEPSQANRLEATLDDRADQLGLPRLLLDLSEAEPLPPQLPRVLSSFRFPHRHADAYLRDAMLDGTRFKDTDVGKAVFGATADNPVALMQWFPQSLLFGFWQSHLGKGAQASQAKLARSWRSSIVGYNPATTETRQLGLKGDPLNLTLGTEGRVEHDPTDEADWSVLEPKAKADKGRESARLSEIGHGQVIVAEGGDQPPAPAGISFESIEQQATVSIPDLRRVWAGDAQANAAARALLVALGLLAHVGTFGRPFSLRSGCDLRPQETVWTWLGAAGDEQVDPLSTDEAASVLGDCVAAAEAAGLPVGSSWAQEPLTLRPSPELVKVIRSTYPAGA